MKKLLTVDIGSFNVKTSNGGIFENRCILDNDSDIFGAETLTYEENTYFFERGAFDKEFVKTKKSIEVPLLYAIGKEGIEGNINLILHLPASQFALKKEIIEKLQGKSFEFKVNGIDHKIIFDKVGVLKEGFSSYYALPKRNTGLIAIIDIGGRTTDVFTFVNGKEEKEISVPIGTMDYFKEIVKKLNLAGENRKIEDIHKLIANEIIDIKDYEEVTQLIANKITNEIKIEISNLNDYDIKLCGGGCEYFEEKFKSSFDKIESIKDSIFSNVNGSYFIGKAKGLE